MGYAEWFVFLSLDAGVCIRVILAKVMRCVLTYTFLTGGFLLKVLTFN